jgi:hypothetical protein
MVVTEHERAVQSGHKPVTMSAHEKSELFTYRAGKKNVSAQEKSELITYRAGKKNVNLLSRRKTEDGTRRVSPKTRHNSLS